ncbi:MAG TPA: DNA mismatch repair protein [Polyangiaceae bacterium]
MAASSPPDLLHPPSTFGGGARIDVTDVRRTMSFAFASGVAGGLFAEALANTKVAPSTWDPSSFVHDLFVADFVAHCLKADRGAEPLVSPTHLVRLLSQPPIDVAIVEHRRKILAELDGSKELRADAEKAYAALRRFRSLLEGASGVMKWDVNRRQIDILVAVKEAFDALADGFEGAESGLASLREFGARVRASEPYASLADLLRYDESLATLDVKVSVGADGRIRGLKVMAIAEDETNPFVSSPLRRWLGKIELFFRGFKMSDGEVMARLIDAVFEGVQDDCLAFVQLLGDLEFYLGALAFADLSRAAGLSVVLPDLVSPNAPRTLDGLFNPLLLAHGVKPVPCTLAIDRHAVTVLVTGPNSGGKTRLMQALGLAQILAQSGLFVPAAKATVAPAPGLVVSLLEETRADQREGRLGTELVRIRELFEELPPGAMIVLGELCSGTNPSEGEEIFELVVRMLDKLAPQVFITTHFLELAARLEKDESFTGLRFLQVELGPDQEPTYQFVPGVARTSLVRQAAERLGVTREQLLALIDKNVSKNSGSTDAR